MRAPPILLVAALVALTACVGAPQQPPCVPIPSGAGGGRGAILGAVGEELRFEVSAPLLACASDVVRVEAEAYDEGNRRVPVSVGNLSVNAGLVTVTVSLTPATPGSYALRVFFEPSLGLVQLSATVAVEQAAVPIVESFPEPMWNCSDGVTRTQAGAVLCSRLQRVTVYRGGVPVDVFDGAGVVVVGDVVWSVTPGGVLQRRVDGDGGLTLTGELPGFFTGASPAAGEHSETVAVRDLAGRRYLTQVRWDADAGLALSGSGAFAAPFQGFAVPQDDDVWQVSSVGSLADLTQPDDPLLLPGTVGGIGPEGAWVSLDRDTTLGLVVRPFTLSSPRLARVPLPSGFVLASEEVSTMRRAAVVPRLSNQLNPSEPRLVLPSWRDGSITLEVWRPAGELLNLTPAWIITHEANGKTLRFYPRPRTTP
ncbi:MAG: hypothetical protein AB1938_31520 [Myxococcota bacterium]